MRTTEDLAQMTAEELASKERKLKMLRTTTVLFLGALVGIAIWSATHKGGFLPFVLLVVALRVVSSTPRQVRELERIQSEMRRRSARD